MSSRILLCLGLALASPVSHAVPCRDLFEFAVQGARPEKFQEWLTRQGPSQILPRTHANLPLLVIGAGPGGLAAMAALKNRGVLFEGVERAQDVGGVWDAQNTESPGYEGLTTNSSKATTHLGQAMPKDWPPFLPAERAHEYLRRFAQDRGLISSIQFSSRVLSFEKQGDESWIVEIQDVASGKITRKRYRGLVVASGTNNKANRLYPADLWQAAQAQGIEAIHASDFENASKYAGKRVLIVGVGNSGTEIATAIAQVATQTLVAVRSTPWIVPLKIFGKPADEFAVSGPKLPHWLEMILFGGLQRLLIGHPKGLGFAPPNHKLLDRLPVSDRGFVKAIKDGKIVLRPNLENFESGKAVYENSAEFPAGDAVDVVIFATGYSRATPFISKGLLNLDDPFFQLSFHLFHPREPGLSVMTEVIVPQGVWPMYAAQADALAAYYVAEARGTSNALAFDGKRRQLNPDFKGAIFSAADLFHVDPAIYVRTLGQFSEWVER